MIKTIDGKFSYYKGPIKNTNPCESVGLERIYNFISKGSLKSLTQQVRSGEALKTVVLPYITASGLFKKRELKEIISYSGIVGIDLDHINIEIKRKLYYDTFLNPALLFISPSNKGIKMFIRVTDAAAGHHDQYFNAISMHLFSTYGVNSDPACRDISRACFLCHDADALYSTGGSVSASDLIHSIPPAGAALSPDPEGFRNLRGLTSITSLIKKGLSIPQLQHCDYSSYICDKLNARSSVYNYACSLLKINGWTQRDIQWFRPGKEFKDGHSAVFNFYGPYGIYLFHNFTSSTPLFVVNKSYTLCHLISILGYNNDFARCMADLQSLFKNNI